MVKIDLET